MVTKVGGIVIDIDARLAKLEASLQKGRSDFKRFEKDIKSSGRNIETSLSSISTGLKATIASVSLASIASAGKAMLDFADSIDATAKQIGISVERYQTLKEGLRSLEVSGGSADKALKSLSDTLGSMQAGTVSEEMSEALDRLGVSQDVLNGKITDAGGLLDGIAKGSKNYATEAQFTADVVTVLGKKVGVDMAAALRDGGTALKGMEDQLRSTGEVISSDTIAKLADANEAIDRFKNQSATTLTIWAGETLDFFGGVMDGLTRLELKYRNFLGADTAGLQAKIDGYTRSQANPAGLKDQMGRVQTAKDQYALSKKVAGNLGGGGWFGEQAVGTAAKALQEETARLRELTGLVNANRSSGAATSSPFSFKPSGKSGSKSSGGGGRSSGGSETDPIQEMLDAVDIDIRNAFTGVADDFYDRMGIRAEESLEKEISNIEDRHELELQLQREKLEEENRFRQDSIHSLSDNFYTLFSKGSDALWKDFEQQGLKALAQIAAQFLITGKVSLGGLLGGAGGGFPTDATSLGIMGITKAIKGIGKFFGGLFADGGRPPMGKWSIVGEKGPELFVPDSAGTILPNHILNGTNPAVARGGGGSFHFDLRGAVLTAELMAQMNAIGDSAAARGAAGGAALANQNGARRQRRRLA